ncbi:unnamed protein product [Ceutorhynchus assimilis]|uniref:Ionotropic receptor n=1 Tax=Ceutorhynchus assimilis TaxID=467358 RepID=A0A9P0DML5_9CUCU|nr:unnamed protein product [Ceutorhynchus assimilis]
MNPIIIAVFCGFFILTCKGYLNIQQQFVLDFFRQEKCDIFNIFGCLTKKERFDFTRNGSNRVNFIKSVKTLKEIDKISWLVADEIDCDINLYLKEINDYGMFRLKFKHLIITTPKNQESLLRQLKVYQILPMSEVIVAAINTSSKTAALIDIYKVANQAEFVKKHYNAWTVSEGLQPIKKTSISYTRRNLKGRSFKFAAVIFGDKTIINHNLDDIILNATMQIIVYDNHGYGKFNKTTNKFNLEGMMKDLAEGNVDLSAPMYLTSERIEFCHALAPLDFSGLQFFLKKPSLSYVKNIYVVTLSNSVLIVTFLITILFMAFLYVSLNWERRSTENMDKNSQKVTISDMVLLSIEAISQQGTETISQKITGRFLLFLLLLMFMFVYVAYSAGLLVLLQTTSNINNLNDLMESRFVVGGFKSRYVKYFFQSPKSGILRKFYLKKIRPDSYFEETEGLEKVQRGNFAFFAQTAPAYKYFLRNFTNYDICSLQEIPGFMEFKLYLSVPKSSGYSNILKPWLLVQRERGLNERLKRRTLIKPKCNNQAGNFQSVRILDCAQVLLFFVYGFIMALVIFFVEIIVARKTKKQTNNN